MIYKEFRGLQLSSLGLGGMRFPILADGSVDEAATAEMVACAMKNGVNYYDTAYNYHKGNSETVMGKILSAYPREQFYFATKFPGFDVNNLKRHEEIFEDQLRKCRVEYFDFYLFHSVSDASVDGYLNPEFGLFDYLMQQKAAGRIRHLGFSCHASLDNMKRFLDAYGENLEFCQIQLNWLDWNYQDAKAKVELLNERNIPIWVMEPLRGGRLVSIGEETEARVHAIRAGESIPGMAFRFLQSIPGVAMVLSGMSNLQQIKENIHTFETSNPLNSSERAALLKIADGMMKNKLPCTQCRYCTEQCPQELDIPMILDLYNELGIMGGSFGVPFELRRTPQEKWPSACIGCRSCESVCPQQIAISEAMADFTARMKA